MTDRTDPPLDRVAEEVVAASSSPARRATSAAAPPAWVGLCTGTGLALIIVGTLTFLGVVAQGMAIEQDTSVWYRQGIGFLRNLDASPIGLMLLLGVALVGVPVVLGAEGRVPAPRNRSVAIALGLAAAIALMVAAGAVLGVITRLHFDTGPGQEVTAVTRRVLATFIVRNLGPALVAFAAALAVVRLGSPSAVTPAPYRDSGGSTRGSDTGDPAGDPTDPEPGPGPGPT